MSVFRKATIANRDRGMSYRNALREAWIYNRDVWERTYNFATIRSLVRMVYGR